MNRSKKDLNEEELEDTKVAEEVTPEKEEVLEPEAEEKEEIPGGIEVPKEEGAKEACEAEEKAPEHKVVKKDPDAFTERVLLGVETIKSKSLQEVITILDYQLEAIRNLAIKKITEYKS